MNTKFKNSTRIGIDGRCLLDKNYTGVSEYTVVLLKKIITDYPEKKIVIFINSFKATCTHKKIDWLKKYKNITIKYYRYPNKLLNFSLWFFQYPKIDKMIGGVDIFISPNISFLAVSKKAKFILTIHDLSFERFRETFSWKRRCWHFIVNPRRLCRKADEIWTVSNSTKWDLESLYRIATDKIKVKTLVRDFTVGTELSNKKNKLKVVRKKYQLPYRFILYLGTIEPRKNIITLVKAYEYLRRNNIIKNNYKLVIAGQLGWHYKKIIKYIQQSKLKEDIIITDFVDQKDKPYIYQLAKVFVYPSLFEGFGIPVLEAMAYGVPVITSNNSSIPEVIGGAGIMIDPDRIDDLIDALEIIIQNQKTREYYIKKGLRQSKEIMKNSKEIKLF